jgi:galactokinase/mevalonate kinase-like predicted kinase
MILVARAPFCLTFGGKGTDAPDYVRRCGGLS